MDTKVLVSRLRSVQAYVWFIACAFWLCAPSAALSQHHGGGGFGHGGGTGSGGFGHGGSGFYHGGNGWGGYNGFSFGLGLGFGGYYTPYYYDQYYYPSVEYVPVYSPPRVVYVDPPEVVRMPRDRYYYDSGRRSSKTYGDDNDYYLNRRARAPKLDVSLSDAIDDIESAFRTKNADLLAKHVVDSYEVAILAKGHDRCTMKGSEYLSVTRGAFRDMDTVSFSLPNVASDSYGAYRVSGTHVVHHAGGDRTYDVTFLLRKHDGKWMIAEVSANPSK
jgi:hypothetical protein